MTIFFLEDQMRHHFFTAFAVLSSVLSSLTASERPEHGLDANGNIVAVWEGFSYDGSQIYARVRSAATNSWGSISTISTSDTAEKPHIAAIENGTDISAVAIWIEIVDEHYVLFASMHPDIATGWTSAAQISSSSDSVQTDHKVSIALNGSGDIYASVSWSAYDDLGNQYVHFNRALVDEVNSWAGLETVSGP
jgi:hypothetical protein